MPAVRHLTDVALLPVVEIEPKGEGLPLPNGTSAELPDEWDRYWRASLVQRGFPAAEPVRPGSWFVALAGLSEEALQAVVAEDIESRGDDASEDDLGPLSGGFVLIGDGEHVIDPMCCGDLANIDEWVVAAAHRGPDWKQVWIGHPWIFARFDGEHLALSDYTEGQEDEPVPRVTVPPESLAAAAEQARSMLEHSASRLVEPVRARFPGVRDVEGLARVLAGLGGP